MSVREDKDPWGRLAQKAGVVARMLRDARQHDRRAEECQEAADKPKSDLARKHNEAAVRINRVMAERLREDTLPVIAEVRALVAELFPKQEE